MQVSLPHVWSRYAAAAWCALWVVGRAHGGPATAPAEAAPYATAHDAPLEAKEAAVARTDVYTQYRVEFNGIRGGRVPAFLYAPDDAKPKHPAVLLLYGSGGNKNTNYIVAIGQRFVARGFVVLTIDVPGRGERKAEKRGLLDNHFLETMGDYSRSTDYLAARGDVDAGRLAYVGISWGAITGIPYVAHDPRIKVMASLVGGGNFLGTLDGNVSPEALKAARAIDPVYNVALIPPRPLLLLNVTHDQLVPRFMADSLHKAAGDGAKKVWLDTDHFFNGVDREKIADSVIEFVEEGFAKKSTP